MLNSSASNREKIYSAGGDVSFGKVYNCCIATPPPHLIPDPGACNHSTSTIHVLLSLYTAVKAIRKSPGSKDNRNKICKKGRTLYVLGEVAGPDTREYFVFSEDTWVFRREWAELKELVTFTGSTVVEMNIIKAGEVKNKWEVPRRSRRKTTKISAFQVKFTNDPMSTVWFTPYGLQHMTELVNALQSQHCTQAGISIDANGGNEKGEVKMPSLDTACKDMHSVPSLEPAPEKELRNTKLCAKEESHLTKLNSDTNRCNYNKKEDSKTEQLDNNNYDNIITINESNQIEDETGNKDEFTCNKEGMEQWERKDYTEQLKQVISQPQPSKIPQVPYEDYSCSNAFEPFLLPQEEYEDCCWPFPYV